MKLPRKGEKGFTLVELLIVLAILAVLAAVVIPNVTGMFGRGAKQAYDTDKETIQMAVATFYFDVHGYDATNGWNETGSEAGHRYPTASGDHTGLYIDQLWWDADNENSYLVRDSGGAVADDADIQGGAIWMGLLVNSAGVADATNPETAGGSSVLAGEKGPYLNEFPESCSTGDTWNGNPATPGGSYTWIVGQDGKVFGVYKVSDIVNGSGTHYTTTDSWVAGFSGSYP